MTLQESNLNLSLTVTGVIVPFGNSIDPGVVVSQQGLDSAQSQFVAPGEQVCAFECRKICYRWLSSKRVDKSRLSKMYHWPAVEISRAGVDGEDDIIEVKLGDVQGLDGDWDTEVVDNEVLIMRSAFPPIVPLLKQRKLELFRRMFAFK